MIHEAFHVARSGRPGPVVIDLPKDILMGPAPYRGRAEVRHRTYNPKAEPQADESTGPSRSWPPPGGRSSMSAAA